MNRTRDAAPSRLAVLTTGEASRGENRLEHSLQMICISYSELQKSVVVPQATVGLNHGSFWPEANALWRQIRQQWIWQGCTFRSRKKRTRFCLRASEHCQRRHTKGDRDAKSSEENWQKKGNASEKPSVHRTSRPRGWMPGETLRIMHESQGKSHA